ncbi:MAG: hypothetical protein EAZ85_07665 [Bacteroidetes bacterium]|nr:MAG: hypothetical protein EAZ85_07665 [Bacteroidota bacterium]
MKLYLLFFIIFCLFIPFSFAQKQQIDSLQRVLAKMEAKNNFQSDTNYFATYHQYAFAFYATNPDSTIILAQKMLVWTIKADNKKWESRALQDIGGGYYAKGNYALGLEYYLKALKILEKIDFKQGLATCYNNIGNIYSSQKKNKLALLHYEKSQKVYQSINDKKGLATCLNNIANHYHQQKQYKKSLELNFEALQINQEIKDEQGMAFNFNNIGFDYLKTEQIEKALEYLTKSLEICKKIGDDDLISEVLMGLGEVEVAKKEYPSAIKFLEQSKEVSIKIGNRENLQKIMFFLSDVYSKQGSYQQSLEFYKLHKIYYDSLVNAENENNTLQLQAQYEYDKKTEFLKLEQQKKDLINDKQISDYRFYMVLFLFLLILFVAGFVFTFTKQRKVSKTNNIISEQKIEIENQNAELEAQAEHLRHVNALKDKLFSIIGHDLRSPLNQLKGVLNVLELGFLNEDEFKNILPSLSQNVTNASSLLDNLLYWAESQMSGEMRKPKVFDLKTIIINNIQLYSRQATQKQVMIDEEIESKIIVYADKDMLDLVVRNLLSNAVKFCNAGSQIKFTSKIMEKYAEICIADTGIGIEAKKIKKIFGEGHATERGTAGEKGTGLGLTLCKDFVEKNGGKIWVESQVGKGTRFYFTVISAV